MDIDLQKLTFEQLAGAGRDNKGNPTFNGWDMESLKGIAEKKLAEKGSLTLVEMLVMVFFAQLEQGEAIKRINAQLEGK